MVRGISGTPWLPNTYEGVWAAEAATNVTIYVAEPIQQAAPNPQDKASHADLLPMSNAKAHGYIAASQVYYSGLNVDEIVYASQNGEAVQYTPNQAWMEEYSYSYTPPNLADTS